MVEHPPDRSLLVFDGDCSFCRAWVDRWHRITGDRADYIAYQELGDRFPDIPREAFASAVQLVLPDGRVFSGVHAVFRLLALVPRKSVPLWLYERIPGFGPVAETVYKLIARHRSFAYRVTKCFWGIPLEPETFCYASWLFLRLLGLIYLIAFLSFGVQAAGLIGSRGISPLSEFLDAARQYFGIARFWHVPTLFWLQGSDAMIRIVWVAGVALSVLLAVGMNNRSLRVALFVFHLSLAVAGQEFMGYQWDALLLEAGFLAIFLGSSTLIIKLFRWLLFRLMFLSGAVKLLSHDPAWRSFTALPVHYETQPLPTPLAWYFYQLPAWFQRVSVGYVFFVELFVPFLILAPRRLRIWAAAMITLLQILIALTGNYAFFNLLTVTLCLFLLDDTFIRRFLRNAIATRISRAIQDSSARIWVRRFCIVIYALVLLVSGFEMAGMFSGTHWRPADKVVAAIAPFEIVNTYGLFAIMTTTRPEITIEGSNDGETWLPYEFKYKPGELNRPPTWVAPHQPRLDWQMWFAALGNYRSNPWILQFMARLLEGSPEVSKLLRNNPFPKAPPRYVRATLYEYHFTDPDQKGKIGNSWRRELKGEYVPAVSLRTQMKRDEPVNPVAYEYYLRGVDLYSRGDILPAIKMLEASTQIDPKYALAWAHLGKAYSAEASLQLCGRDRYRKAQAAFEKSLSLQPEQIEPQIYLANLLTDTGKVEGALPLLRRALQTNPNPFAESNGVPNHQMLAGGDERCITCAKRTCPLWAVRMSLSEQTRATVVFRSSCSKGTPDRDRVRTGILMMRSSLSVRAGDYGR